MPHSLHLLLGQPHGESLAPTKRDFVQDFFRDRIEALTIEELKLFGIAQLEPSHTKKPPRFLGIAQLERSITIEERRLFGIAQIESFLQ
jgi:hypothetical protein